jgi:hypothetical protein
VEIQHGIIVESLTKPNLHKIEISSEKRSTGNCFAILQLQAGLKKIKKKRG